MWCVFYLLLLSNQQPLLLLPLTITIIYYFSLLLLPGVFFLLFSPSWRLASSLERYLETSRDGVRHALTYLLHLLRKMADFEASQDENDAIVLVLVFLLFYIFPASLYFLYKLCSGTCSLCCQQDESKRKTKSGGFRKCEYLNVAIYVLLCGIFYAYLQKVEPVSDLNDPFEILGVSSSASKRKIKKAYRKLALAHHPDKGGDVKKFREIHDAYRTLTNPVAKRNWQLHGHPDGPQMYRVKVLPLLYTEDGAQGPLLFVYLIFVIGLPTTCYCYCFSPSLQDKKKTELMIRLSQAFRKNIKRSNVNIFNIVSTVTSSLAVTDTLSDDNQGGRCIQAFQENCNVI